MFKDRQAGIIYSIALFTVAMAAGLLLSLLLVDESSASYKHGQIDALSGHVVYVPHVDTTWTRKE